MSSEFEYRRLAASCLDLAKRSGVLADKTRLLLIAEAWLELADRVTKSRNHKRRTGLEHAEHPLITEALGQRALGQSEGA